MNITRANKTNVTDLSYNMELAMGRRGATGLGAIQFAATRVRDFYTLYTGSERMEFINDWKHYILCLDSLVDVPYEQS